MYLDLQIHSKMMTQNFVGGSRGFRVVFFPVLLVLVLAMVKKVEPKKTLKKVIKSLPYKEDGPSTNIRPSDMKTRQLQWLISGLHHLKAPIASNLKSIDVVGGKWLKKIRRQNITPKTCNIQYTQVQGMISTT